MPYLGTIKIKELEHPLVVTFDDTELLKRPLYERIQFCWSNDYIGKYTKIKEYNMKISKCRPLI